MDKKLESKRLFLYLALSFFLTWIVFFTYIITGHKWDGSNPRMEGLSALGMLIPVLAHVLTRWITKEGFPLTGKGSMMLGISLKNKKWMFYLFALFMPWIYFEIGHGLSLLIYPDLFDPEYYKVMGIAKNMIPLLPLAAIINGAIGSFAAFGEEGGWRGYMMPKLIELVGTKKAVFIGGIIWGVWHAPLTCVGHNFGLDYPGFPYLGILIMCVDCTFMGVMLIYITQKTNSIWPATIMHAVNNANPSILAVYINTERAAEVMPNPIVGFVILLIPTIVIGSICLVLLCREKGTI
ncbi:MAG: CPBP family intramembrane metalloprotease [Lachnospiraceae bacterium]|nr:CPBP family intramembrane metalloprotease [Lachnospiraceae bacterium]